jgi:hypothetical protein
MRSVFQLKFGVNNGFCNICATAGATEVEGTGFCVARWAMGRGNYRGKI